MKTKEEILVELYAIISDMKSSYDWGGGEDPESGSLRPGEPDWDGAKEKIKTIISANFQ
ncbi:MAG: hypothetical protein G01um101419_37 [Parcubacteria group bacterium Gr01-1014_19]|nr:MAG: hypothetical protein G01um101419_37 [Parcubacteria group bacterium Gr01-1014_19]